MLIFSKNKKQKTKKLKNGEKKFPGTPIYTYYFYYEIRP